MLLKTPTWNMMMMQDPANMIMMFMSMTHSTIMEMIIFIMTLIMMMIYYLMMNKSTNRMMTQSNLLEFTWTILPMMILIYMAAPSLQLLYLLEETKTPSLTIKSIAHQWYWTYEYPDFKKSLDSYMLTDSKINKFRLLDVDNRLILPYCMNTRILCSSSDVIHSWSIPSLGIKMDALPGRINQVMITPSTMGLFFGQCSEICGMNHSFMPIVMEIVSVNMFINWIKNHI